MPGTPSLRTLRVGPATYVVSLPGPLDPATAVLLETALAEMGGCSVIVDLLAAPTVDEPLHRAIVDSAARSNVTVVGHELLLHTFELLGARDVGLRTSLATAVAEAT